MLHRLRLFLRHSRCCCYRRPNSQESRGIENKRRHEIKAGYVASIQLIYVLGIGPMPRQTINICHILVNV